MKKIIYPAVFFEETKDTYSVFFPDFNYLTTCGNGITEAFDMAKDLLNSTIITMFKEDLILPSPSNINDSLDIKTENYLKDDLKMEHFNYINKFVSYVTVDILSEKISRKKIKKTLCIPEWLDELAKSENINFSQTLEEALRNKLEIGE